MRTSIAAWKPALLCPATTLFLFPDHVLTACDFFCFLISTDAWLNEPTPTLLDEGSPNLKFFTVVLLLEIVVFCDDPEVVLNV